MTDSLDILKASRQASDSAHNWADLSNALFDQVDGLLAHAFPTQEARAKFVKTDEYKQIRRLLERATERSGLVEGATPTKSGRLLVRLPKSMHSALEIEAESEGVSLNQLVVTKLALRLSSIRAKRPGDQLPTVIQAYAETRHGASEDRVVADPKLNAAFLSRCRELGATESDYELNWKLLSARKNGHTANLPPVGKFSIPREVVDRYQDASEMALRYIQRQQLAQSQRDVSLDTIICDPILVAAFDEFASRLAPGFSPLQYRWGALGLRKAGRYMKEAMAVDLPLFEDYGKASSLQLGRIPEAQGLYLLQNPSARIFLGETRNLRMRVKRHLDVNGSRMIPEWLYGAGHQETRLSIVPLPAVNETELRAIELRAIMAFTPVLNYPRTAA